MSKTVRKSSNVFYHNVFLTQHVSIYHFASRQFKLKDLIIQCLILNIYDCYNLVHRTRCSIFFFFFVSMPYIVYIYMYLKIYLFQIKTMILDLFNIMGALGLTGFPRLKKTL